MTTQHTPELAALLASELAEMDGMDDDSLFQLQWSGGSAPEPMGDAWNMDYLPKGERLAEIVERHYSGLKQQREDLRALNAELVAAIMDDTANRTAMPKSCGHDFFCICSSNRIRAAIEQSEAVKS